MKFNLKARWSFRLNLRAEGDKLWAECDKLRAEGGLLRAECDKLRAEGGLLRAEGDKLWAEGIILVHGNILIEWKYRDTDYDCLVAGELYKHRKVRATLAEAKKDVKKINWKR